MGLKPDHWIRKMAHEYRMIEPFEEKQSFIRFMRSVSAALPGQAP